MSRSALRRLLASGALLSVGLTAVIFSRRTPDASAREAADELRALYWAQDFRLGRERGALLSAQFPGSAPVRAWYALHGAKADAQDEALAVAQELLAREPDNPWSHFALAGALLWSHDRHDEVLAASERALAADPNHHDFLWMRAETLRLRRPKDEAIALLDSKREALERSAELLAVKGSALFDQSMAERFEATKMAAALETFARARAVDPRNVNAHVNPGWFLMAAGRPAEAHPLLKTAASLTLSLRVHAYYWGSVLRGTGRTLAEKRAELEPDLTALADQRGGDPAVLAAIAQAHRELQLSDRQKAIEDRLLQQHPDSREAEQTQMGRFIAMSQDVSGNPERLAEFRAGLRSFIARERHHDKRILSDVYVMLFNSLRDDHSVGADDLLKVIRGMSKTLEDYVDPRSFQAVHAWGAMALADRKAHLEDAEALPLAGLRKVESVVAGVRVDEAGRRELYNGLVASMRDALGWVYFTQGRTDEAERELLSAHDQHGGSLSVAQHLGTLYEARGDRARAEAWYVRCLAMPTHGENPCARGLREHYGTRNSNASGFERYRASLEKRVAKEEQARIAASRIAAAKKPPAFRLQALSGEEIASDSLRGRVTVINFWALWCGACVVEMPLLDRLARKYRGTDDVAILTINNDRDTNRVREWMKENGYEFPVLVDDGFLERAEVHVAPTTWFLDKSGAKAFEVRGTLPSMEKEFTARIETLRGR